MELLVIKTGTDYLRIKNGSYLVVGLDKASVFPFERLADVKTHLTDARDNGFTETAIYRLSLTETPL